MEVLTLKFSYPTGNTEDLQAIDELVEMTDMDIAMFLGSETEATDGGMMTHHFDFFVDVPAPLWYGKLEERYHYWEDDGFDTEMTASEFADRYCEETNRARRFWRYWRGLKEVYDGKCKVSDGMRHEVAQVSRPFRDDEVLFTFKDGSTASIAFPTAKDALTVYNMFYKKK